MRKRLLAMLIALVMVASLLPVAALAAGDGEYDIVRLMDRSEWSKAVHARAGVEVGNVVSMQRFFIYDANHSQMNSGAATGLLTPDCYYADTHDVAVEDIQTIVVILTSDGKTISAAFDTEDFEVTGTGSVAATKHIELTLTERGKGRPAGHQVNFYAELNDETTYSLYDTVYVQHGQQIGDQMPNDPPVGSYVFLGWQTEEDGGTSVDRNTYVYSDMNVYAAKGTAGTGHAQEYHVMGSTDKRSNALAIEVADHYNSANNTDYGVESFTIEDISVNGTVSNTNPIYAENEWKDEGSYYYVYNVSRDPVEVIPEYHNDRVEVADITGITVYGKLNGSDYSQFIPVSELSITEVQNNVVVELRVREKLDGVTKELVTTSDVSAPSVEGVTIPDIGETVAVPENGSVTLMYKISVFGDAGAAYNVTDENATVVNGYSLQGTIDSSRVAVIYVTKTFTADDITNGCLTNNATVVPGDNSTLGTDDGDNDDEAIVDAEVDDDPQPPAETVTLTYDANGGTDAPDKEEGLAKDEWHTMSTQVPNHQDVNNVKVVFGGWSPDNAVIGQVYDRDGEPTGICLNNQVYMSMDMTVYAVWGLDENDNDIPDFKENKYTVTYTDGAGGKVFTDQVYSNLLEGEATPKYSGTLTHPDGLSFSGWDPEVSAKVTGNATYTATWTVPSTPKTDPVYVVIYRNGDTDEPYKSTKLGDYDKGDSVDLSALKIADYYSSAYGFEFEGWYNDGGWNKYKAGNPNNKLGDSITVNGWTNIICMVTDYEKVVVKSVVDGDKDNAETIYTGEALHGTNLIDYLDESFTPADKPGYELDKWYNWDWYGHKYSDTATVNGWTNVYVTYTSVEPDAPTAEDLAALKLKVQIDCIDLGVHPNRDYAIEDGTFTTDVKLVNGEWQCALSVEGSAYLTKYNAEFGKHEFSGSSTKTKTLVYGAAGWTLENPSNDRIVFDVRCVEPEAPTYDVLKDMIKVQIDCINKEVSHSNADYDLIENSYDLGTLTANADGTWSCTLTVKSDAYIAKYNETQPGHTLADAYASKNVALVYSVDGKWSRADTSNNIAAVFDVKCAAVPVTPIIPLPTVDEIAELIDSKIIVDCVNVDAAHADKSYGLIDGALVKVAMTDSTTVKVTLSANVYLAQYNDDDASAKHSLASGQSATVTFTLKYVDSKWTLPADAGELPATIKVVCDTPAAPKAPTEDELKVLFDGKVFVDCVEKSWHPTYVYGLLANGYTVAGPVKGEDGEYTCTVTLLASAYLAEYNDDVTEKHALASYQGSETVSLKWTGSAWTVINGELPVTFDVVCDTWYPPIIPPVTPSEPDYTPNWLNTTDHVSYIIGYEDGTVKPGAGITRAEVATIFFRLLTDGARERFWSETNAYSDVAAGSWYNIAVSTLSNMGILGGYEDGTFRPNASITRAEFAKIAVSFFDWADVYAVNGFVDVRGIAWYADYVAVAAELGLIEGYGGNVFRPDATITRAEACTIINRTLGRNPDADHLLPVAQMNTWPDNSDTGVWYYAQIQEATNSHDYRWIGSVEQWTAKLTDPDWDKLQY